MNTNNTPESLVICPVCKVKLDPITGTVYFSHGNPGSTNRLAARVCQFAKDKNNCINQGYDLGSIPRHEFYD